MIEAAERDGRLKPGGVIVEPTSGNTGVGLAMVAAVKGYRAIMIMPESASMERRKVMAAFGAELILTPAAKGIKASIAEANALVEAHPDYFMPNQFANPANPDAHLRTTGPEIIEQVPGPIDAFVAGVGTGGTITGAGAALKAKYPDIEIIALEPAGSPVLSGGQPGKAKIQGIGAGFVPDVLDMSIIDEIVLVGDDEAWEMARRLPREEGIFAGLSSGAAVWGAIQVARRLGPGKTVVTVLPSYGERYLSTGVFDPSTD
jgi:cysteine synthase A